MPVIDRKKFINTREKEPKSITKLSRKTPRKNNEEKSKMSRQKSTRAAGARLEKSFAPLKSRAKRIKSKIGLAFTSAMENRKNRQSSSEDNERSMMAKTRSQSTTIDLPTVKIEKIGEKVRNFVNKGPINEQNVQNVVTAMKKRTEMAAAATATRTMATIKKGDSVFISKKTKGLIKFDDEVTCESVEPETVLIVPSDNSRLFNNNENGGKLFVRGKPFWVYPRAPTEVDMKGVDETPEITAETVIQVTEGNMKLETMPPKPVDLDTFDDLAVLKNRDSMFFQPKIIVGNTLRSIISTTCQGIDQEIMAESEKRIKMKTIAYKNPTSTIFYKRKTRRQCRSEPFLHRKMEENN